MVEWKEKLDKEIIEILSTEYKSSKKVIFDNEARIKFIFTELFNKKINKKTKIEIDDPIIQSKSDVFARFYMNEGMIYELKSESDISYDLYTQGIAYAEPGSPLLGALYFVRGKILYCHKLLRDSLADSERALDCMPPENLFRYDLYTQMAECHLGLAKWNLTCSRSFLGLTKLGDYEDMSKKLHENDTFIKNSSNMYKWDSRPLPPLVQAVHDVLPEFTDALEVKFNKEFGAHVITTRDIEPGEILCVEQAYAITVNRGLRYNICSYCKIQTWSSIPCENCVQVVYCSIQCRESAYHEYHDVECIVIPQLLSYGIQDKFLMALRLTVIGMKEIDNSIDAMRHKISVNDKFMIPSLVFNQLVIGALSEMEYDSIYATASKYSPHLMTHKSQSVASCVIIAYFYGVAINLFKKKKKVNLQTLVNDENFLFLVQFIEINTRIANFNGLNMSMPLINRRSIKVSNAVHCYSNLFPHSCRKMIAHSLHHNRISIRSVCSIKKGEQVFDNYGISFDNYDKKTRQELLKNLNYICKCKVCVDDVKMEPAETSVVPGYDLTDLRTEIEILHQTMDDLDSTSIKKYIVNDQLTLPQYTPDSKFIPELIMEVEDFLEYNTKEFNECIGIFLDVIAVEQVPYLTLQDIQKITAKP